MNAKIKKQEIVVSQVIKDFNEELDIAIEKLRQMELRDNGETPTIKRMLEIFDGLLYCHLNKKAVDNLKKVHHEVTLLNEYYTQGIKR